MMRRVLLLALALALPLQAAELEVGIRHVVMQPMGDQSFPGGKLDLPLARGFGASAEVFWTERVSTQLAATFVNPEAILRPATPPPNDVDLGTLGIAMYTLSARYHFRADARFSPFAGAGGALVTLGDLDDQFGDAIEVRFPHETTFLAEAGVRYRFRPSVRFELGASYMPLEARARVERNMNVPRVELPSRVAVDPLTISGAVAWRF
ncbi:MAG: outer membrane beta-barrel protein [Acidobacteria bacterium]|nr:outer membrane beta-barrel protein [Acidobacteriota bacterium]MBV9477903.1 outer membrane beta-barrel protein [Acidobacteriota bacterium]